MKLTTIIYEIEVNATKEKAWEVLASFGDVENVHDGIETSHIINNDINTFDFGTERICYFTFNKRKIITKEKIVDLKEGEYYTYIVYESKNIPLKKMFNSLGVRSDVSGKTFIYQILEYRLTPNLLTILMKRKMISWVKANLHNYRNSIETSKNRNRHKFNS